MNTKLNIVNWIVLILLLVEKSLGEEFNPLVSAHCERGYMFINVITKKPFNGIVHTRDFRNNSLCYVAGTALRNTTLRISAVANRGEHNYCGVTGNQDADEQRQVAVAVRTHKSIELSDDKYFLITCGQSSYFNNARKVRSRVKLQILNTEDSKSSGLKNPVQPSRLIIGNAYVLRAQLSEPDQEHQLFLKHCIAFSQLNATETLLIDDHGCSTDHSIISPFNYNNSSQHLDASIYSMFKFPDVYRVHIQCDAVLCRNSYASKCFRQYTCNSQREPRVKTDFIEDSSFDLHLDNEENNLHESLLNNRLTNENSNENPNEIHIVSATTAYVLEPDQDLLDFVKRNDDCTEWNFPWLIGLCAILATLLAIMLVVNICLCTSLTCTCVKQDVLEKEDASELADYDPYKIDWAANNSHLYNTSRVNSLPRQQSYTNYHANDFQEEYDYNNTINQRPNSRYSNSIANYAGGKGGYHNYGYR